MAKQGKKDGNGGGGNGAGVGASSPKPYLLRAIYQWALDHHLTPQVLVDAGADEVMVPQDYVQDGRIVLTIHPQSVARLDLGNRYVSFSARFAGRSFDVGFPVTAVAAIFCRENGQGLVFQADGTGVPEPNPPNPPKTRSRAKPTKVVDNKGKVGGKKTRKTAHLTLVK